MNSRPADDRAPEPAERPTVLRALSSQISFWAVSVVIVLLFGDAVVRGQWGFAARWAPLGILVVFLLWLVLMRSSIRFTRSRLTIINALRVHEIPWSRVLEVRQGPQITFELVGGRVIAAFGGPFPPRPGTKAARSLTPEIETLRARAESAPVDRSDARSFWDVPTMIAGALLLVWALGAAFVLPG